MKDVVVAGIGIHPYGRFETGYRELGAHAAREALDDANVQLSDLDYVFVANVGAEMAKGHNVVEQLGRPGVPIINVESACASSAGALLLGGQLIESGAAKVVLCVGVEKFPKGFIASAGFEDWQTQSGIGITPIYFALGAQELIRERGVTEEDLADVAVKNHNHSVDNPNAMYRSRFTREQVLASKDVCPPLKLLMLCAPNEGAAAAVLMSRDEASRRGIVDPVSLRAVGIVSRATDDWFIPASTFQTSKRTNLTERAARLAYEEASIGPSDIDLVECQDTDAASELHAYSDLGLCEPGDEAKLLRTGATTLGGSIPVNVSGGLLSKGEPLGASGLGMLHELTQQLRRRSGTRQVEGAKVGVGHVMGAGHAVAVTVVSR